MTGRYSNYVLSREIVKWAWGCYEGLGHDVSSGYGGFFVEGFFLCENGDDLLLFFAGNVLFNIFLVYEIDDFHLCDACLFFYGGWNHGDEDLAEGADVIAADPSGQFHERSIEEGLGVDDFFYEL